MDKIKIPHLNHVHFSTDITVQIGDINYGNHLSNDAVLKLCHEARLRFLNHFGYSEMDVAGAGLIMADAAIQFLNQAFYGDKLCFAMAIEHIGSAGFAMVTEISCPAKNIDIARVKNGMVFFDYSSQKITKTPVAFREQFS